MGLFPYLQALGPLWFLFIHIASIRLAVVLSYLEKVATKYGVVAQWPFSGTFRAVETWTWFSDMVVFVLRFSQRIQDERTSSP